jgi:hypothetical protein
MATDPTDDLRYEQLPAAVKNNLSAEQWQEVGGLVVWEGATVPEATIYVNLKNGQHVRYERGARAPAPLLAAHNLAGARGKDSTQFHTAPAGAPLDT